MLDKIYGPLIVISVSTLIAAAGRLYYNDTRDTIDELTRQNSELFVSVEELKNSNNRLVQERQTLQSNLNTLNGRLKQSEEYQDALEKKLRDNNLVYLSLKKPGLIEKRVNDATDKVFRDIESLTGGERVQRDQ